MSEQIYCARHDTWHSAQSACLHCAAAAQLNDLRQTIGTLEARLADANTQAMQDRRRIDALEHRISAVQAAQNRHAACACCNRVAAQ